MIEKERPNGSAENGACGPEDEVEAVAEGYLARLQVGERPDRDAVLAAHPKIAHLLEERLDLIEDLHRSLRASPTPSPSPKEQGPTIRGDEPAGGEPSRHA